MFRARTIFSSPRWRLITCSFGLVLALAAIAGLYVLNVAWRVGCAEEELFGINCTVSMHKPTRDFCDGPIPASYGFNTYVFNRNGKRIVVYRQLINGFQHAYGSALVTMDLGDVIADFLFRANEYEEAYTKEDGQFYDHYLDTKKDLANNVVGRRIADEAKRKGLSGAAAEKFIRESVLAAMDSGEILNSFRNPRVEQLPSLEDYGCPGLPHPKKPGS